MRHAAVLVSLALALAGCLNKRAPVDRSLESTFPRQPRATTLPRALRVVTFNVHREPGDVVARGIARDRALRDADVIILEEVHRVEAGMGDARCSAACALARELGMYALYAPGHVQGDGTDGVAILSRAPISAGEVIELPFFDVTFNSGRRVALAATILVDDGPVTVYAVHLDNRLTVDQRRVQLEPVLAHAAGQGRPVIIGGDFNTSPFTWIRGVIPIPIGTQDDHVETLVRAYGFDTPVTASGPTSRFLAMKLDALYTKGFTTHAFATARADDLSDHLPLWASLEVTP